MDGQHVVQRGENLFRIALRYGVTVDAMAQANGLANPNQIYVGQTLVIPVEAMAPGSVVIMSVTVAPEFARALGKRLAERRIEMLDAPVSGGAAKAAQGQMTIMGSGAPASFAKVEKVLAAIAQKVYRLGDEVGPGSTVKMINQLLAGVHIAAAAEAMALVYLDSDYWLLTLLEREH